MKILLGALMLLVTVGISPSAHAASVCSEGENVHNDVLDNDGSSNPDPKIALKLAADISKCQVGDVVWLPSLLVKLVAKTCDFSKQIVVLPQSLPGDSYSAYTMCIIGPPKGDD
jgi:hypothetical protein